MPYTDKHLLIILLLTLFISTGCQNRQEEITTETLLLEMTDRALLARYPSVTYQTLQSSSYDRHAQEKGDKEWFANWDRSYFLRVDTIESRTEYVLLDVQGPGAMVRFWVTVADYSHKGILRIYLDDQPHPVIEGDLLSIIGGDQLVASPLSESVASETAFLQRGHNLYLPIAYQKSCKITYQSPAMVGQGKDSGECLYYSINYRTYPKGTPIKTFSISDLSTYSSTIEKTLSTLQSPYSVAAADLQEYTTGGQLSKDSLTLEIKQGAAIQKLSIRLHSTAIEQALRSTILKIKFDNTPTLWVPIGDFFGIGNRFSELSTYYTHVSQDSTLTCYWVMPFKNSCHITIENLIETPVTVSLTASTSPWKWDKRSMHFGAGWTEYQKINTGKTRSMEGTTDQKDVNFVQLTGKGVYVGDALTLFNSVADWWGEGDEKIYIDNETFPSHFGTGTEDYYGYAWCMHNVFHHPFIAQSDGTGATQVGHVSNLRYRALDAIPFQKSLHFDMEIWHWANTQINYAPTTYWYMLPEGTSNRGQENEKAASPIAQHKNDLVSNSPDADGIIEAEFMDIRLSGGIERSQTIPAMGWSNLAQFCWTDGKINDQADLTFQVREKGNYKIIFRYTAAPDYGIFQLRLNNQIILSKLDEYSPTLSAQTMEFKSVSLQQGANTFSFRLLGKNSSSRNTFLGIDCIQIIKN